MNNKNKWSSNRLRNFQLGILVALATVFMAFEWSSSPPDYREETVWEDSTYIIPLERTVQITKAKKVPPPPVVTATIDIIEEAVEYTNEPIVDVKMNDEVISKEPIEVSTVADPPIALESAPLVEPIVEDVDENPIHFRVEHMPLFGSKCSDLASSREKNLCSEKAMLKFVYKHVKYPSWARENGIQGTVIVQFVIEKDGSISHVKVMREIGGGCGKEVERLVKLMPNWIPGRQGIHKVRVKYSLPVRFSLQ